MILSVGKRLPKIDGNTNSGSGKSRHFGANPQRGRGARCRVCDLPRVETMRKEQGTNLVQWRAMEGLVRRKILLNIDENCSIAVLEKNKNRAARIQKMANCFRDCQDLF